MPRLPEKLLLLHLLLALSAGCKPKIGDECKLSTDCSAAGDRLCDMSAHGGYCTVYNCVPGACPEDESLCVEFGAQRSPAAACQDLQAPSPYARTFCMATCESDSDCRDGYVCRDLSGDNDWDALLIDLDRGDKACMVPVSTTEFMEGGEGFGAACQAELPSPDDEQSAAGGAGG